MVSLREIIDQMDVVNDYFHAYLNKETGELITITSEEIDAIKNGDDWAVHPDWQQEALVDTKKVLETLDYLPLPSKFDNDEYSIMKGYCSSIDNPDLSNELSCKIRGPGVFRRFKEAIRCHGIEDEWYRCRDEALEGIAIEWLESNEIAYSKTGKRAGREKPLVE